jgi:hypothetical protein
MTQFTHMGTTLGGPLLCSICQLPIPPEGPPNSPSSHLWRGGHNAQPVNDGRCCAKCNLAVVEPARINLLRAEDRIRQEVNRLAEILRDPEPEEESPR